MKTLPSLQSHVTFMLFCVAILLAGLASSQAESRRIIILPEVKIKDATLVEAVAYIKKAAESLDQWEGSHLNVIIMGAGAEQQKKRISLDVREIPLKSALEQIASMTGMKLRIEAHAVVLVPSSSSDELRTVVYRVPPYFIQAGSAAK